MIPLCEIHRIPLEFVDGDDTITGFGCPAKDCRITWTIRTERTS